MLRHSNVLLAADNKALKLKFLKERVMLRKARINAMKEKLKTGDLSQDPTVEARIQDQMKRKVTAQEKRESAARYRAGHGGSKTLIPFVGDQFVKVPQKGHGQVMKKAHTQVLAGKHMNSCDGKRPCHEVWQDDVEDDAKAGENVDTVTGLPLDPYLKKTKPDAYNHEWHKLIPENSRHHLILGDKQLGAGDNFVSFQHTGLAPKIYSTPPWKKGLGTGDIDLSYSEGVAANDDLEDTDNPGSEGVYEDLPLSAAKKPDWHKEWLESQGIKVDGFGLDPNEQRQSIPLDDDEEDGGEYDEMDDPQWGFENHAMKSQGWKADSDENRQLVDGSGELGRPLDDDFVSSDKYKEQLSHEPDTSAQDEHFGSMEHSDPKNLKMLYGDEHHGYIKSGTGEYQRNDWALTDVPADAQDVANRLHARSDTIRTGEPLSDTLVYGARAWQGKNMVHSSDQNVETGEDVDSGDDLDEESGVEKAGVNAK